MSSWKKISSKIAYRTSHFSVREDQVVDPSGAKSVYHVVDIVPAITIVALDAQNRIYLLEEEKYIPGKIWTVPAGKIEPGETPLACAKRELKEEAGLIAKKWTALGKFFSSPGFSNGTGHCFLAQEISEGKQELEPSEKIKVVKVPFAKTLKMIKEGKIIDGWAIIPIFKAKLFLNL